MDLDEIEKRRIQTAYAKSAQTGTTTPLLKEVLRLKIQSSRLDKGQEELPKTEFKEPESHPLTAEEERRRDRRRERNRVAARKCRMKKKSAVEQAEDSFREEMSRKNRLLIQIRKMEEEKKSLEEKLGLSVEVEMEKPVSKRKKRAESSSSTAALTPERPVPSPLCTTPLKMATPSHSPLPVPARPPPPYTPTHQSPYFYPQGSYNQLNQGPPPLPVFNPTQRDFDPLLSPRPSCTATSTYSEMLAESPLQHSPSLHVLTELPPFDTPPQVSTSTYHPMVDLLAVSPSSTDFFTKSPPTTLHTSYQSPEPPAASPSAQSSLHALTESPLPESPILHHSPYQPGPMIDLLAMSPSAEYFRPQSPPLLSPPWVETSPIPTLPSELSTFCAFDFNFLPREQLVPVEQQEKIKPASLSGNIPSTVFETLEKGMKSDLYKSQEMGLLDEAQVPGNMLTSDDELASSQESELLYTMYS